MTEIVITNSLIKQFKSCQNATKYKYVELLTPKIARSKPLKRGVWFHALLEAKYKGEDVKAVHRSFIAQYNNLFAEEQEILGDLPTEMARLYNSYNWHYRGDKSLKYLEVELKIEAELPSGMQGQGKADGLVEYNDELWLIDHKTHNKLPNWEYRLLDPQAPFYIWMARKAGIPVRGFIWNYVVPTAPSPLRFTKEGELYKKQPAVMDYPTVAKMWPKEIHPYLNQEVRAILDKLKAVRYDDDVTQTSPVFRRDFLEYSEEAIQCVIDDISSAGERYEQWVLDTTVGHKAPERTVTRNCEWCDYRTLCIAELTGQNAKGVRHNQFKEHDPMAYYQDGQV